MSKEGDRQSVFRTTKVRTALKGDSSWIQRSKGFEQAEDEKPWVAEVRAGRLNGAFSDPILDTTSTEQDPQPSPSTDTPKTPSSGYLIRGVFTKTETKSTQPSSANGHIGTSGFVKKTSDGYKKIAPHTVRSSIDVTEPSEQLLSTEEQDRRAEAASSVLRSAAGRQRSYVLSAAKKYETSEKPDSSAPPTTSFVAKRVVICDDEDNHPVEPKVETPVTPSGGVTQQRYSVEMSVDESAPPVAATRTKDTSATLESKPRDKAEATPTKSVWNPVTPAPEAEKVTLPVPEPKTEPTSKPSAITSISPDPVKSETPSTVPEAKPKPDASPKQSVWNPVAQVTPAPEAEKVTLPVPEPKTEPTSKPSAITSISPDPVKSETPSTVPEAKPKPDASPKQSVWNLFAQVTPAPEAEKVTLPVPEPKSEPTSKPSAITSISPDPVKSETPSTVPEAKPKPDASPKQSVWNPVAQVTPAPEAEKVTLPVPEPKTEPTSKPSVTDPVAQKATSTTPEPKPKSTPKQRVSETNASVIPATPDPQPPEPTLKTRESTTLADPVAPKHTSKTQQTKPEITPKQRLTEPITPAAPVAQKDPSKTVESKPEVTPKQSVKTVEKTSDLNDVDFLGLTQSTLEKPVDPFPTTTDLLLELGSSLPQSEKTQSSLDLLALDVIPIDTSSNKLKSDKLNTKIETTQTAVHSKDSKSSTEMVTITTTAVEIIKGTVPHSEYSTLPQSDETGKSLDLLAADVIPIDTNMDNSLPQSEKTQSSLDLLALDVNPIDTSSNKLSSTKSQSKVETSQTLMLPKEDSKSSLPQSEKTQRSLDLLALDVIPIDTSSNNTKSESQVETSQTLMLPKEDSKSSLPQSEKTQESQDLLEFEVIPTNKTDNENMAGDATNTLDFDDIPTDTDTMSQNSKQKTVTVTFEKKSSDSASPWDDWTLPTVHTTIQQRETKVDPQPMADSYTYPRVLGSSVEEPKTLDADIKKNFVYVKEYVNLSELSALNSISDGDYLTSTTTSYAYSSPPSVNMTVCTYCGGLVGNDAKITIEHLNISCHPDCFKCGICSKPMGDFLDSMFLHRGTVHCESCYANVL